MSDPHSTTSALPRQPARRAVLRGSLGAAVAGSLAPWARGNSSREEAFTPAHPLFPKAVHHSPKARRVIMIFLNGGLSHVDSFDPKPALERDHGKTVSGKAKLLRSPWAARPHGESGLLVTDLFPRIADCADDLAVIRSMHGDHGDHFEATLGMHTGSNGSALPGIGAWLSYGLGTDNPNLPSHVVLAARNPYAGSQVWDSNFLPAMHQGVRITPGDQPIPNLQPRQPSPRLRELEVGFLETLNRHHAAQRPTDGKLSDRMQSFRTALGMQAQAPRVFDCSNESAATLDLYGVKPGDGRGFAWQCLIARRLAEAGVRFIELIDPNNWDAHGNIADHGKMAPAIDRPIAALLIDLKQRGMLDDTLVVFCTEFGRTPASISAGREHHRHAFSCWLAGGGAKGGIAHGETDEHGITVARDGVHVHDFHATILHLLGLNHERLTFHHAGRDHRLTDVYGNVVHALLA